LFHTAPASTMRILSWLPEKCPNKEKVSQGTFSFVSALI
jgi:hypothetical protein